MYPKAGTGPSPPLTAHIEKAISRLSALSANLRLVDYLTFAYLTVIALLLVFFHRGVPFWPLLVLANFVAIALIVLFANFTARRSSKILGFFRDAYPIFLCTFMFKEVATIVNVLFPFWFEQYLIDIDYWLFGANPTVWVQQLYRPWLTEFMAFSYWSYYLILPLTGIALYFKKDKSLFRSYVFHFSLTLYTCYILYPILTARGPRETLAHLHLSREAAGFFDSFVQVIQANASIVGAAFPSAHVAAVIIAWIFLYRFRKWLGLLMLPLIVALCLSVVYLQYHYAVDPIAAVLLVCILYPAGRFLERVFGSD